jgi:hypothetical protein
MASRPAWAHAAGRRESLGQPLCPPQRGSLRGDVASGRGLVSLHVLARAAGNPWRAGHTGAAARVRRSGLALCGICHHQHLHGWYRADTVVGIATVMAGQCTDYLHARAQVRAESFRKAGTALGVIETRADIPGAGMSRRGMGDQRRQMYLVGSDCCSSVSVKNNRVVIAFLARTGLYYTIKMNVVWR